MRKLTTLEKLNFNKAEIPEEYHGFIYKTVFPNGKIYIGQTIRPLHITYFGSGILVTTAINKYTIESLKREILRFSSSQKDMNTWEQIFIKKFKSTDLRIGYNLEKKSFGRERYTEETRMKIRLISLGLKRSPETIERIRQAALKRFENPEQRLRQCRPCTEETKAKLRAKGLGRKVSEETKAKISIANKKKKI